jgi:hypothetical protein
MSFPVVRAEYLAVKKHRISPVKIIGSMVPFRGHGQLPFPLNLAYSYSLTNRVVIIFHTYQSEFQQHERVFTVTFNGNFGN